MSKCSSFISFHNHSNNTFLHSQVSLWGFYVLFSVIIFLFLSLLYVPDTDIVLSEFFSIQLRTSTAQFLLYPSITSFLLDFCQQYSSFVKRVINCNSQSEIIQMEVMELLHIVQEKSGHSLHAHHSISWDEIYCLGHRVYYGHHYINPYGLWELYYKVYNYCFPLCIWNRERVQFTDR